MTRTASILVLLLAACGSKTTGAPVGNTGGGGAGMKVTLVDVSGDDGTWTPTLAADADTHFPAVSADGKTVVHLVADAEDFSGIPIATVVFWTKDGETASIQLASQFAEDVSPDQADKEQAALTQINAKLAETTWTPIDEVLATGESEDTGAPDTITLGDGSVIKLEEVADKFPAPGSASEEMGGGGCGEILGLYSGFGSKQLGFAVVFPSAGLGGDDCFGAPSAGLAIVVPLS